jgi:hypothetical protein
MFKRDWGTKMQINGIEVLVSQIYFFSIKSRPLLDRKHLVLVRWVIRKSKVEAREAYLLLEKIISSGP